VKLLFDQHLSHKLVALLADKFPASDHVRNRGLKDASDDDVWAVAQRGQFLIVTKDEDFHTRSIMHGHPPKVLWIRSGNCSTELVETLLRKNFAEIEKFVADPDVGFMALR
jgi:predicted nuclease of predicted toxin-antitoxin system